MNHAKTPCGGFEYDENDFEFAIVDGKKVLRAKHGGGSIVIDDETPSTRTVYSSAKVEETVDKAISWNQ